MARMIAYSMIAQKMLKIHMTIYLSIAFSLLEAAAGARALTSLKTFVMTRKRTTRRDILPGTTFGSIMKLIQDTVTNRIHGM